MAQEPIRLFNEDDVPRTTIAGDGDVIVLDGPEGLRAQTIADLKAQLATQFADAPETFLGARVLEWAMGGNYVLSNIQYDSDGARTTATVEWLDHSGGVYTTTVKNSVNPALVDAYTITHTTSGKTVTQPAVTRDANGKVITQPIPTIS